jgi:hypothetical protein
VTRTTCAELCGRSTAAAAAAGEAKARLQLRILEASEPGTPLTVEAAIAQLRAARGPDGYDLLEVRRRGFCYITCYMTCCITCMLSCLCIAC